MTSLPFVSVVVPTKNSSKTLSACLQSIRSQNYPNIELIVVDNFSRDRTKLIAQEYGAIFLQRGSEKSAQLNYAIRKSKGEYVYRIDSDMVASEDTIAEAVYTCEKLRVDGVIIRCVSDPRISYWSKVRFYERLNHYRYPYNVAVRFFSRRSFDKIGGFDESLSGFEDYDFQDRFLASGYKFARIKSGELHIGEPKSIADVIRKHFYYGKSLRKYLFKNKNNYKRLMPIRKGQVSLLHILVSQPDFIAIGVVLYQATRYLATLVGALFEWS